MSKKLMAILLAVCLMMALAVPTFAVEFTDTDSHWGELHRKMG